MEGWSSSSEVVVVETWEVVVYEAEGVDEFDCGGCALAQPGGLQVVFWGGLVAGELGECGVVGVPEEEWSEAFTGCEGCVADGAGE